MIDNVSLNVLNRSVFCAPVLYSVYPFTETWHGHEDINICILNRQVDQWVFKSPEKNI